MLQLIPINPIAIPLSDKTISFIDWTANYSRRNQNVDCIKVAIYDNTETLVRVEDVAIDQSIINNWGEDEVITAHVLEVLNLQILNQP